MRGLSRLKAEVAVRRKEAWSPITWNERKRLWLVENVYGQTDCALQRLEAPFAMSCPSELFPSISCRVRQWLDLEFYGRLNSTF